MNARSFIWAGVILAVLGGRARSQDQAVRIDVNWDKVIRISNTTPTLQVVVNPPLRRGTAVHDNAFKALHDLGADYVRYVPWLPYPRLGVAESEPPKDGKTSWDFSLIDPMTIDCLEATKGHSVVLNFSTIPQWMYKTDKRITYPDDPNKAVWDYEQGTELRDLTFQEVEVSQLCSLFVVPYRLIWIIRIRDAFVSLVHPLRDSTEIEDD